MEVNQAVEAAKSAFGHWSKLSGMERARIMIEAAHIIEVFFVLSCSLIFFLVVCFHAPPENMSTGTKIT